MPKHHDWTDSELERRDIVLAGGTVLLNMTIDAALQHWAKENGLFVRIDRRSKSCWGNPFIVDEDGDRDTVIASYRDHFLPYKPSLARRLPELRGKVLGCWCYPKRCHGNLLIEALGPGR